jgi:hypothetical protein
MPNIFHINRKGRTVECACCKDFCDKTEFQPQKFSKGQRTGVEIHYGGPVCVNCMEDQVYCEDTGNYIAADDAHRDEWSGICYEHPEGLAAADAEAREWSAHCDAERSNLRVI